MEGLTCALRIVLVVSSAGIGNCHASSTDGIFQKKKNVTLLTTYLFVKLSAALESRLL